MPTETVFLVLDDMTHLGSPATWGLKARRVDLARGNVVAS